MKTGLFAGLVCVLLTVAPHSASAVDWYVTLGGTGLETGADWNNAFPTVAAGLLASKSGDTIRVWAGIYPERITLKSGVILSGGYFFGGWYPFTSILDGGNGGSVVTVESGAGPGTVLEGFTIQNGSGTRSEKPYRTTWGGGVYCVDAQPTIRYDLVTNCHATYGGGLYLNNAACDISLCHITNNRAAYGAGLFSDNGSPPIYICTFSGNVADHNGGAVAASGAPSLMLACNVFEANTAANAGSAVIVDGGTTLNNTFIRNTGPANGSLSITAGTSAQVVNNIIAGNNAGVWVAPGAAASIDHNDVFGNALGNYTGISDPTSTNGNICADPALADPLVGDVTPCPGSPCIDKGDDSLVQTGWNDYYLHPRISGVCADIGAAEWIQTPPKPMAIRVRPDGDDAYAGADWGHPMKTVQAAVNDAMLHNKEVWVAAGTYNETVKIVNSNVMLFGGFAGNETVRNQRDPAKNPTILDGSLRNDSVMTITGEPVAAQFVDNRTIVDGFTIRQGMGYSYDSATRIGGGIRVDIAAPVISGNTIEDCNTPAVNAYGGGIYVEVEMPETIPDMPYIACNTIQNNSSRIGGGVYITYSNAVVRNNIFKGNDAANTNGWPGFGGGIGTEHANVTFTGNLIQNNHTGDAGGGIYCYDGPVVIRGNRIQQNTATQFSAGIQCSADAQIVNNTITGNQSYQAVGGLALQNGTITVANNLIAGNKAPGYGGGVWGQEANVNLYNNTFAGNDAEAIELIATASTRTLNIANNIISGSPTGILVNAPAPSTVALATNCLFGNGKDYTYVSPGASDIKADPHFVNPTGGNYRLLPNSICIDAATDSSAVGDWDLDGQPRVLGSHVDFGAYEYASAAGVGLQGVIAALRISGGLQAATPSGVASLDVVTGGTSAGKVDLVDAVRLARIAAGLG